MKSGSFDSYRDALSGTGADFGGEPEEIPMTPTPEDLAEAEKAYNISVMIWIPDRIAKVAVYADRIKMLSELIARVRQEAYERGRREATEMKGDA